MKNIFGINITDKKNDKIDGYKFLFETINDEQQEHLNAKSDEFDKEVEKGSELPKVFRIVQVVIFFIAIIATAIFFNLLDEDNGIADLYNRLPWMVAIIFIAWGVYLVLFLLGRKKQKEYTKSEVYEERVENLIETVEEMKKVLNIPKDAYEMDFLTHAYRVNKKGDVKNMPYPGFSHYNQNVFVFVKDESFIIGSAHETLKISLNYFKEIITINDKARILPWNKEVEPNTETYKLKLATNKAVILPKHYKVIIDDGFEQFYLLIPPYEIDEFVKMTNIKINNEDGILNEE